MQSRCPWNTWWLLLCCFRIYEMGSLLITGKKCKGTFHPVTVYSMAHFAQCEGGPMPSIPRNELKLWTFAPLFIIIGVLRTISCLNISLHFLPFRCGSLTSTMVHYLSIHCVLHTDHSFSNFFCQKLGNVYFAFCFGREDIESKVAKVICQWHFSKCKSSSNQRRY